MYDIQEYLYNLEAIAQRCGRTGRLIQLADNLIEAYTKLEPYICFVESGSLKAKLVADVQGVLIVKNIGCDITLPAAVAHVLAPKNRAVMQPVYDLSSSELPALDTTKKFAAQLVGRVWNGDKKAQLFTN